MNLYADKRKENHEEKETMSISLKCPLSETIVNNKGDIRNGNEQRRKIIITE